MLTRIISAVIGILILGYIINTGNYIFYLGIYILNLCALYELSNAFKQKGININLILDAAVAGILLYFANFSAEFDFIFAYLAIILIIIITFLYNLVNNNKKSLTDSVFSIFSFAYTSFLFMCIILVRNLPNGTILTWWIFITIWACDTGAFFSGVAFGKRLLAPTISPKKTLEGSMGGVLSSVLACAVFAKYFIPEAAITYVIALGFLISLFSQAGDLAASLIKRYCGLKDFSNIIPGHGGVLDRLDSALFSFPVAYIYILFILQKGGF